MKLDILIAVTLWTVLVQAAPTLPTTVQEGNPKISSVENTARKRLKMTTTPKTINVAEADTQMAVKVVTVTITTLATTPVAQTEENPVFYALPRTRMNPKLPLGFPPGSRVTSAATYIEEAEAIFPGVGPTLPGFKSNKVARSTMKTVAIPNNSDGNSNGDGIGIGNAAAIAAAPGSGSGSGSVMPDASNGTVHIDPAALFAYNLFNRPLTYEEYYKRNWMWIRCRTTSSQQFDVGGSWVRDHGLRWLKFLQKPICGPINWQFNYNNNLGWGDGVVMFEWYLPFCTMQTSVRAAIDAARTEALLKRRHLYIYNCPGFAHYPWSYSDQRVALETEPQPPPVTTRSYDDPLTTRYRYLPPQDGD